MQGMGEGEGYLDMPIHQNVKQCSHIKIDGNRCGSPALTGNIGCHFHNHIFRERKQFALPPLEDANSVQVTIMEIMLALVEDRMDRAKAATLLYACQIAQSNLRNISLSPNMETESDDPDEMSLAQILLKELRESSDSDNGDKEDAAPLRSAR